MRRSTLVTTVLAIIFVAAFVRFHYSKGHLAGNFYFATYFPNNNGILFKSDDGKFIPVLKDGIKETVLLDSLLFVTKVNGDSTSYFIIDTRKDFSLTKGQNVIGPISRSVYLKLYSNSGQLKNTWNIYKRLQ